jgi:hypothetical protein
LFTGNRDQNTLSQGMVKKSLDDDDGDDAEREPVEPLTSPCHSNSDLVVESQFK